MTAASPVAYLGEVLEYLAYCRANPQADRHHHPTAQGAVKMIRHPEDEAELIRTAYGITASRATCAYCKLPLDPMLTRNGISAHPGCGPEPLVPGAESAGELQVLGVFSDVIREIGEEHE